MGEPPQMALNFMKFWLVDNRPPLPLGAGKTHRKRFMACLPSSVYEISNGEGDSYN